MDSQKCKCGHMMSSAEVAAYGSRCENCFAEIYLLRTTKVLTTAKRMKVNGIMQSLDLEPIAKTRRRKVKGFQ